jgi:hypothetical protein
MSRSSSNPCGPGAPGERNSQLVCCQTRAGAIRHFDTFPDAAGRDAHLKGEIARALFARAEELFSTPPQVEQGAILASKTPHS